MRVRVRVRARARARVQLRGATLILRPREIGLGEFRRLEELRLGLDPLRLRLRG